MTEIKELRIPYDDLTRVVIPCSRCGLEIAIDITRLQRDVKARSISCPICPNTRLDSQYGLVLDELVGWYDRLAQNKLTLSFRISRSLSSPE